MKKFKAIFLLIMVTTFAQSQIGHTTITFNDPTRTGGYGSGGGSGRQIQTEIYYPAASSGDNVAVVGTSLPIIAFGHGFVMSWDSYDNIWTSLVNEGYVVAFPRTEGGFSPSHSDFGLDLALVVAKMKGLNTSASSLFYNKLDSTSAIMGHSMGGGSSFLACESAPDITTMVTLAAANTNPSAITAAQQITIPALVISGVNDCVAPPAQHQDLMYDSLNSPYKTQINIIGGGHCYFANSNTNCSIGEGTCSPNPSISRAEQQSATMDMAKLWLRKYLKHDCAAAAAFQDSLLISSRITYRQNNSIACTTNGINQLTETKIKVYPNPTSSLLNIVSPEAETRLMIRNVAGQILFSKTLIYPNETVDISELQDGFYLVELATKNGTSFRSLIKSTQEVQ